LVYRVIFGFNKWLQVVAVFKTVSIAKVLQHMQSGKPLGGLDEVTEMVNASGEDDDVCNSIIDDEKIPTNWQTSIIIPIYKVKADSLETDFIELLSC
jgi:hypothetical protein